MYLVTSRLHHLSTSISKLNLKSLLIILVLLLIGIVSLWRITSFNSKKVAAAWWNDGWTYRQRVDITNPSGSPLTDFQVSFSIGTSALINSGHMKADCSDLRITDQNGKLVNFWVEEDNPGCNKPTDTKIWVKMSSIPTSGLPLYVYYGNPSAASAAVPGSQIFEFYEDFNSASLDSSRWTATGGYSISGGTLAITTGAVYSNAPVLSSSQNYVYETLGLWTTNAGSYSGLQISNENHIHSSNGGPNQCAMFMATSTANFSVLAYAGDGTTTSFNMVNSATQFTATQNLPVVYSFSIGTSLSYYQNRTLTNSYAGSWNSAPYLWLGYFTGSLASVSDGKDLITDWVIIRKYVASPPTSSLTASEEVTQAPIAYWKFDEGVGTSAYDGGSSHSDGLISNATWADSSQCISGSCLYFNGTNAGVNLSALPKISAPYTISLWIKPQKLSATQSFLSLNNTNYPQFNLQANGRLLTYSGSEKYRYGSKTFASDDLNKWYHIVMTVPDGNNLTNWKVYVNGQDGTGSPGANTGLYYDPGATGRIGNANGGQFFQGYIDDVKIYPYTRTSAQVLQEYQSASTGLSSKKAVSVNAGSSPNSNKALSDGLVGYWKMDENYPQMVANGNFSVGTSGWANNSFDTFDASSGALRIVEGSLTDWSSTTQNVGLVVGKTYVYSFSATKNGTTTMLFQQGPNTTITSLAVGGTYSGTFTASQAGQIGFKVAAIDGGFDWTIDNISLREATLNDVSGNNNTTTLGTGDSAPAWASGKYGVGLSFNGSSSYVSLVGSSSLSPSSAWTLNTWINPSETVTGGSNVQALISKWLSSNGLGINYYLGINASGRLTTQASPSTCNASATSTIGNTVLSPNQWLMVTSVFNGANQTLTLYVNGVQDGTSTLPFSQACANAANPRLGQFDFPWSAYRDEYNGLMDEVRIYNRALSLSEVQQLYSYAPSPVAYWKLDDGTNSIIDSSGNNFNGTLASGTWVTGKYGKAVSFDGANTSITVNDTSNSQLDVSNAITIEAWVKNAGTTGSYDTILRKDSAYGLRYANTTGALQGMVWIGGSPVYTTALPYAQAWDTQNWTHFSVVYDGRVLSLYKNGAKVVADVVTSGPIDTNSNPLYIGSLAASYRHNGLIDDVKIYNYARTQKQIIEDMNAGHPVGGSPVGSQLLYYKFDEGYGTVTANWGNAGVGYSGTFSGTTLPVWVNDGKFGKAINFNNSSGYVNVPTTTALQNFSQKTVSMWLYPQALPGASSDFYHNGYWIAPFGDLMRYSSAGKIMFYLKMADGNVFQDTSSVTAPVNQWSHFAYSWNGTKADLYLNGRYVASVGASGLLACSGESLRIGGRNGSFPGILDEVKIYNAALSASDIALDYNQGKSLVMGSLSSGTGNTASSTAYSQIYCVPGDSSPCSPPLADWKFDEGVGTTTYNSADNNHPALIYNGTWSLGKTGRSISFNGSSTYVDNTTLDNANFPQTAGTLSLWIKGNITPQTFKSIFDDFANRNHIFIRTNDGSATNLQVFYQNAAGSYIAGGGFHLNDNTWNFLSTDYDTTTDKVNIYLNGVRVYSGTMSDTTWTPSNQDVVFSSGTRFTGLIDQVKIYNYVRSPAQIALDYNGGKPIAWYKFDECQGNTVYDWSGFGSSGTINIGASGTQNSLGTCSVGTSAAWTAGAVGKLNSSLNFDGRDDGVTFTAPNAINPASGSVSIWAKPSSTQNAASGYYIFEHFAANSRVYISTNNVGNWISTTLSTGTNICSSGVATNTWHHVVLTWNGTTAACYIDGQNRTTNSTITALTNASPNFYVGYYSDQSQAFTGQVDDLRIFPYSLTSTQVDTIYNNGAVNFAPSQGSP